MVIKKCTNSFSIINVFFIYVVLDFSILHLLSLMCNVSFRSLIYSFIYFYLAIWAHFYFKQVISISIFIRKNFFPNLGMINASHSFPWASFDFVVLYFSFQGIPGFTGNIGSPGYPGRQVR